MTATAVADPSTYQAKRLLWAEPSRNADHPPAGPGWSAVGTGRPPSASNAHAEQWLRKGHGAPCHEQHDLHAALAESLAAQPEADQHEADPADQRVAARPGEHPTELGQIGVVGVGVGLGREPQAVPVHHRGDDAGHHEGGQGRRQQPRRGDAPQDRDDRQQQAVVGKDQVHDADEGPDQQPDGREERSPHDEHAVGGAAGHQQPGAQTQQHTEDRRGAAVGDLVDHLEPARVVGVQGEGEVGEQHAGEGEGAGEVEPVQAPEPTAGRCRLHRRGEPRHGPVVAPPTVTWLVAPLSARPKAALMRFSSGPQDPACLLQPSPQGTSGSKACRR